MIIHFKTTKNNKFKAIDEVDNITTLVGSDILNIRQLKALAQLGMEVVVDGGVDLPSAVYSAKGVF